MKLTGRKFKVGIDIDNVICDSYPAYLAKYNLTFGEKITFEEITDFYYLDRAAGSRVSGFIDTLVTNEEFQLELPPFTEATDVIKKWANRFSIHYITARPRQAEIATRQWLEKHGFWVKGATLDLFDKRTGYPTDVEYKKDLAEKFKIDVFIEDALEIAKALKIPVILFDRPWNKGKHSSRIRRVKTWQQAKEELEKIISIGIF